MTRFRIRPEDYSGYPVFFLEEETRRMFGSTWIKHDREVVYVTKDSPYEKASAEAIEALRQDHREIMRRRGLMVKHLETPVIYLEE